MSSQDWPLGGRTRPGIGRPAREIAFAGSAPRVAAYLVDAVIVGAIATTVLSLLLGRTPAPGSDPAAAAQLTLLIAGIGLPYFVVSWATRLRGTPGQRLLGMRVGHAFDGRTLTVGEAVRRWAVLGAPLALLALAPAAGSIGATAQLAWSMVLLVTVATSATRQGVHDRVAGSAVVVRGDERGRGIAVVAFALVALVLLTLVVVGAQLYALLAESAIAG